MSATLTALRTMLYTRLRGDLASPGASDVDLDANSVLQWANESLPVVTEMLLEGRKLDHIQTLVFMDYGLTFVSGVSNASLPSNFHLGLAVRIVSGSDVIPADLTLSPEEFAQWSSVNFLLTAQTNRPIALIAKDEVRIKPISITAGYLDYLKEHPELSGSQGTEWTDLADQVLIELIAEKYYEFQSISGEAEVWVALGQKAHAKAQEIAYGLPRQPNTGQGQT